MPPRGSNSEVEQERIARNEDKPGRTEGKSGTGTVPHERPGYGNNGMQQNPKKNKAPEF